MNQLGRRQGAVVCGLLLGILLLAGCGSQNNQSASALDRLSTAPASKGTASFGVTFEAPELQAAPRAGLTLKLPGLEGAALPQSNAPMRITFEQASEAHSQVQTQAVAQHACMH
jgi:hypothetical protein